MAGTGPVMQLRVQPVRTARPRVRCTGLSLWHRMGEMTQCREPGGEHQEVPDDEDQEALDDEVLKGPDDEYQSCVGGMVGKVVCWEVHKL